MSLGFNQRASIIAVCGSMPHAGVTMMAVNIATALRQTTGAPTALVDLDTQASPCCRRLGIPQPARTLQNLAAVPPSDLSEQVVGDAAAAHYSGLHVFCSSRENGRISSGDAIQTPNDLGSAFQALKNVVILQSAPPDMTIIANLDTVINRLAHIYRYLVLDIPPEMLPSIRPVLAQAAAVLTIANLYDLNSVNDMRQFLAVECRPAEHSRVKVVLNRVTRNNRIPLADIQGVLGHGIAAQIPNDAEIVQASIKERMPFVLSQPESAIAVTITQLASSLQ